MSEKTEIAFMQTRLIRLALEEGHLPVEQIIHLFNRVKQVPCFNCVEQ